MKDINDFGREVETLGHSEVAETLEQLEVVDNLDEDFGAGTEGEVDNNLVVQAETAEGVDSTDAFDHLHVTLEAADAVGNLERCFHFWILTLGSSLCSLI